MEPRCYHFGFQYVANGKCVFIYRSVYLCGGLDSPKLCIARFHICECFTAQSACGCGQCKSLYYFTQHKYAAHRYSCRSLHLFLDAYNRTF